MRIRITKRHLEALEKHYRAFLLFLGELAVVGLIFLFAQLNLFDLTTVVSVTVPDLIIGILLYYYLLGQGRRGHEEEISNLFDVAKKLSHLTVYKFTLLGADFYYVENTTTKEYYKAPKEIEKMVDLELGVLTVVECKKEEDMKTILQKNGSHPNEKEPTIIQLMPVKHRRRQAVADSDSETHASK